MLLELLHTLNVLYLLQHMHYCVLSNSPTKLLKVFAYLSAVHVHVDLCITSSGLYTSTLHHFLRVVH